MPQLKKIRGVRLGGTSAGDTDTTWDVTIEYPPNCPEGVISSASPNDPPSPTTSSPPLLLPALVHPHIHLDKAFILNSTSYNNLLPSTGSFQEALTSTSKAKEAFTHADILARGEWLLADSVASGVTAIRGFVEVDHTVQRTCLNAGLVLKEKWKDACDIQLVCYAQDPIFSTTLGEENRRLIDAAIRDHAPDKLGVLGTTPYVESSIEASRQNIEWAVATALQNDRHLDFHLDYSLAPPEEDPEPLIWHVLRTLRALGWTSQNTNKRVMLGHCTRFSLFKEEDWMRLGREVHDNELPVSFVGLPTSDLYMAATPSGNDTGIKTNPRGTLPVPAMVRKLELDAVISVNNVGNAFTPWGSADPLGLACLGVGMYQAGTVSDAELLYECVSTRARAAIGLSSPSQSDPGVCLKQGDCADFLLLYDGDDTGLLEPGASRARKSIAEVVWDPPVRTSRAVVSRGRVVKRAQLAASEAVFQFLE